MRVTEGSNYEAVRENIRRSKEKMENLQIQSSTLKKVNRPSDDPVAAARLLGIRTDQANNSQFQMNSRSVENFLMNTDQAASDLSEVVLRAKEIALGQSSVVSSSDDTRMGIAQEVLQLFQQAVSVANRRVGDRYLFGGYKTQNPPVDPAGEYWGDDGQMMVEVGDDVFMSMNVPGNEMFNTQPRPQHSALMAYGEPSPENVNLFDELQKLRISLLSGDLEGIRGTLEPFDQLRSKLISTRAQVGSRLQGLQYANQANERHTISNSVLSSSLEDADMAQVVSDLNKEETIFRNALATSKKMVQPTLLDFLK